MEKLNILWIEDQNKLLEQMVKPLEKEHNVNTKRTALEARSVMENYSTDKMSIDCIILDLIIPTGSKDSDIEPPPFIGLELLEDIIEKYGFPKKRILVFTVVRDSNINKRVKDLGVYKTIHKGKYLPSEMKKDVYEMVGYDDGIKEKK